jgi:pyruvate formate-lyase activating enzyme-like uncharacterized protein
MTCTVCKTPYHSWKTGNLARGCRLCVTGEKLVLFITGICAQRCIYCPVAEHKFGKDVVYANEWKVKDPEHPKEMLEEIKLTRAHGAGITGGDPLVNMRRTTGYIRLLKKRFGKPFHIHLYTPLKLVTPDNLKRLSDAGLDEIRFHPNLEDNSLWPRIELARRFKWDIGVEIPAVPGYASQTKALIDYIFDKVKFINLNELELSDTSAPHYRLNEMFKAKDEISYGVKGSEKLGRAMLKYACKKGLSAHYCTARLKDRVQVGNRLIRRAKSIALQTDKVTSEGTLLRGCVYLVEAAPGFHYRKRLEEANHDQLLSKLKACRSRLPKTLAAKVSIDDQKYRLLTSKALVLKNKALFKKMKLIPTVVEEYPTSDGLEVDLRLV